MEFSFEQENEFYKRALQHSTIGAPGRAYLEKRGINEETVKVWEIGWCPVGHDKYKKLKGRITFPVRDQKGQIVTISGRKVFDAIQGPKYDMYPFAARRTLFGLWQNKETIRELNRAVITEGQIDVITAWQQGFKVATSTFGAHGTLWHLSNLARYAKKIDILYDADAAGMEGVEGIKKLSTLGDLEIKFNNPFPKGEDLDNWIGKHGAEELFSLLDKDKISSLRDRLKQLGRRI